MSPADPVPARKEMTIMPQEQEDDYDTWLLKLPVEFQLDMPDNAAEIYDALIAMYDPAQGYDEALDKELASLPIPEWDPSLRPD